MRVFVITDTHFGHRSLADKYQTRPFDFEQRIIQNWRQVVGEKDTVIHLGDVVVGKSTDWSSIMSQLPGRKVLVQGNHDHNTPHWYMTNGIDFCCKQFLWDIYGVNILFSHYPSYAGDFDLNIHGHLHLGHHPEYQGDERHYLLAMENCGYQLRLLEWIVKDWKKSNRKE